VVVVADGPLRTIPFEFFLNGYTAAERAAFERAKAEGDGSAERPYLIEYANLAYLSRKHRFAYLPSLSSLASQRLYPKRAALSKLELVAFADPVFNADASRAMPRDTQQALAQLHVRFTKSGNGAPNIARLAETADDAKEL